MGLDEEGINQLEEQMEGLSQIKKKVKCDFKKVLLGAPGWLS